MCLYKPSAKFNKKTKLLVNTKQSLKTKSLVNINSLLIIKKNFSNIGLPEKFASLLMKHGKKCKAYTILHQALNLLYAKNSSLTMPLIKTSLNNQFPDEKFPARLQNKNLFLNRNDKNIDLKKLNGKNLDKSTQPV